MAYGVARAAYANRGRIAWAAKKIGRAYRSYRSRKAKFSTRNIGERVGSATSKKFTIQDNTAVSFNTRQLYTRDLTAIPRNTTDNDIDQRERQVANIRGVKFCWELRNNADRPLYVNVAILNPKDNDQISGTNFFRGSGNERSVDFSTNLTSSDFHCRPISTDTFNIVMHKRFRVDPQSGSTPGTYTANVGRNFLNWNHYQKIKRQVRYENVNTSVAVEGRLFIVFWCDQFMTPSATLSVSNVLSISERYITYFRDPK